MRDSWRLLPVLILGFAVRVAAGAPHLSPGDALPRLDAVSLASEPQSLPADAQGHAFVLVIGFSKAASKVTSGWLDACRAAGAAQPPESALRCYDVRMLEDVPRAFRGMIEHGMRSGLPVELQRRALLVYEGNDLWRERVGVGDAKTAYVVGCDGQGRVQRMAEGPFTDAELQTILAGIASSSKKSEP